MNIKENLQKQLNQYHDPFLNKNWLDAKVTPQINITDDAIQIRLILGYPSTYNQTQRQTDLQSYLTPHIPADKTLHIEIQHRIETHVANPRLSALPLIKNIIAVASGKGGVGKSTVAVNLALALAQAGAAVGLLDADIYGPSQPMMLGTTGEKPIIKDKTIQPIKRHGIQSMSIGYLVDPQAAMMWRGPMLGKALEQLLHDTQWGQLDYLIVDLPPGTGDIQLTLCQKMPVSGAVIVTTPQDLALLDVKRACEMFVKLNVPVLGIVENMSHYHCSHCGHEEALFGAGGGAKLAADYGVQMLAQIPLATSIREMTDSGQPPIVQTEKNQYADLFFAAALKIAGALSLLPKDYSVKFPKIVVENSSSA
ncbi:MAG TPA: iron-sulfur cluster carrier protein ApbC [Gammaproteobacteria bacterium]|jgi:ATP-binding protein involved in chromosome partitioning|nr:iron-sulfur cluster carrier protein ApbC [Gammaproteobacteria bacterium]